MVSIAGSLPNNAPIVGVCQAFHSIFWLGVPSDVLVLVRYIPAIPEVGCREDPAIVAFRG